MTLPDRVTIAGREFVVEVRRSRKRAGGGRGDWAGQRITLYHWATTTCGEMLDTLLHEAVELWATGRRAHYTNGDDVVMMLRHGDLREFCGLLAGLTAQVANLNGGALDLTAPWRENITPPVRIAGEGGSDGREE